MKALITLWIINCNFLKTVSTNRVRLLNSRLLIYKEITMKKLIATCTLSLLILTNTSYAKEQQISSVERMFAVMGMDKQMTGGFEAMLPVIEQMASQLQLDDAAKEELKNIYRDWFKYDFDQQAILTKLVAVYSGSFTDKEINELIAFYETPTGQKFLAKSPQLMQFGAQLGMQEGQLKQALLLERLQPFLAKHQGK